MNLLRIKGKKHSLLPFAQKESVMATILSDLSSGFRGNSTLNTDQIHSLINEMVLPLSTPLTPDGRTYLSIKKKLKEQDLCVVKEDKGGGPYHYE